MHIKFSLREAKADGYAMEAGAAKPLRNSHAAVGRSFVRLPALWWRGCRFGRFIAHAYGLSR